MSDVLKQGMQVWIRPAILSWSILWGTSSQACSREIIDVIRNEIFPIQGRYANRGLSRSTISSEYGYIGGVPKAPLRGEENTLLCERAMRYRYK